MAQSPHIDERPALLAMTQELDASLRTGSPDRGREILDRLSLLFLESVERLGPEGSLAFDEAFARLVPVNGEPARARLSQVVAPFANGPRRTVRLLAYDEAPAVAGPVLRASPLLDEDDLVVVVRERGAEHMLAVAARPVVPEAVTSLLVERGGAEVALAAVRNPGARLSNRACARLMIQATDAADLRRALQLRTDLPRAQLERLGASVRAAAATPSPPRSVAKLGAGFRAFLTRTARENPRLGELSRALLAVTAAARGAGIGETQIAEWLRTGEHDKAVAAIAFATRLPVSLVQRAHRSTQPDGFELIACSAGYGFDTFELALMSNPAWTLDAAAVERLVADYRELRPEEAQLAIRLAMADLRRSGGARRAS